MPVGRIILKTISESKKLSNLKTDGARLLYTWLIVHLDVNGCYSGDPMVIKGKVFTRLNKSLRTIEEYLKDLESQRLLFRYQVNGDVFLNVPDFKERQPSLNPEREGKTFIPLPTPDQLKSNPGVTPTEVKYKLNISKDNTSVFNFWNTKKIIIHRKLNHATNTKISSKLKEYKLGEIQQAINNYAIILKDDKYYFKYSWTLADFLQRGLEKFADLKIAQKNYGKDSQTKEEPHIISARKCFARNPGCYSAVTESDKKSCQWCAENLRQ